MEELPSKNSACKKILRKPPNIAIDQDTLRSLGTACSVLPLFEKKIFDYTRMKHYSLNNNELLRCQWHEFVKHIEGRKRIPFQFPKADDIHFYNFHTCYAPSQSIVGHSTRNQVRRETARSALGYAPVADEMHVRKTHLHKGMKTRVKSAKAKPKKRILRI